MKRRKSFVKDAEARAERDLVLRLAKERGIGLAILTDNHIKFEDTSFYPTTGTICVDGQSAKTEKGAAAFIELIERQLKGLGPRLIQINPRR